MFPTRLQNQGQPWLSLIPFVDVLLPMLALAFFIPYKTKKHPKIW